MRREAAFHGRPLPPNDPFVLGPRVILVDDLAESREMVREFLHDEGIAVVGEAINGGEAVNVAAVLEPDVVVMDLRMPGMDGIEATRKIKRSNPNIQVIMLSFYDEPEMQAAASRVGVFDFVVKGNSFLRLPESILDAWEHKASLERWGEDERGAIGL